MIDQARLDRFGQQMVDDLAAAYAGAMTSIGHKLGLWRALAGAGPITPAALAERTGCAERYVREWLSCQAAGGYVDYDAAEGTFTLPDEHAAFLADPDSPAFVAPAYDVVSAVWHGEEKVTEAFRTGRGIGWHEHHHSLFHGTEAFFRTGYRAFLTSEWIPALTGIAERFAERGGRIADVGCGHGASSILMAQAWPKVQVDGFDYHGGSIDTARQRAADAGVADRVAFAQATAKDYPGAGYDLICFMDCLHDLGDPLGAARHARQALAEDGSVLLVEPWAGDRLEDNLNPVGRLYYAASTALCTPNSLSQEVGTALGAQAGEARLTAILSEAGFGTIRRAAQTAFNLILEARP